MLKPCWLQVHAFHSLGKQPWLEVQLTWKLMCDSGKVGYWSFQGKSVLNFKLKDSCVYASYVYIFIQSCSWFLSENSKANNHPANSPAWAHPQRSQGEDKDKCGRCSEILKKKNLTLKVSYSRCRVLSRSLHNPSRIASTWALWL